MTIKTLLIYRQVLLVQNVMAPQERGRSTLLAIMEPMSSI